MRFDSHVHAGYTVTPHYDSMIGKLIVHQPTRQEAIACMKRALAELRIEGVQTTVPAAPEDPRPSGLLSKPASTRRSSSGRGRAGIALDPIACEPWTVAASAARTTRATALSTPRRLELFSPN